MRWRVEFFDEAGSTNDLARESAEVGEGGVFVARKQTAGRGQRGNSWSSEPGANLTLSVVLEPVFLAAANQFLLSEAVALAVADAIEKSGVAAAVKWPNDIYVGDRKIAGILIENDIRGACLSRSVVGIGLNVNQTVFDPSLPNPVSLRQLTGIEYDLRTVLNAVLDALAARYSALAQGSDPSPAYNAKLYRGGIPAPFALPGGERFTATLRTVLPTGELVVAMPDDQTRRFLFKEIEFL